MQPADHVPVYKALAACKAEALEAWRQHHFSTKPLELMLAQHVDRVETTLSERHGGNIWVTVAIYTYVPRYNDVQAFRLQRAGNKVYRPSTTV